MNDPGREPDTMAARHQMVEIIRADMPEEHYEIFVGQSGQANA